VAKSAPGPAPAGVVPGVKGAIPGQPTFQPPAGGGGAPSSFGGSGGRSGVTLMGGGSGGASGGIGGMNGGVASYGAPGVSSPVAGGTTPGLTANAGGNTSVYGAQQPTVNANPADGTRSIPTRPLRTVPGTEIGTSPQEVQRAGQQYGLPLPPGLDPNNSGNNNNNSGPPFPTPISVPQRRLQ